MIVPTDAARRRFAASHGAHDLQELSLWVAQGLLPEMIPTRQQRSLRTARALMEAGRALLLSRSLDDLPVETICEHAGTTVGAFYGRFENKHAFFVTMQRSQVIRSQAALAAFVASHAADSTTFDSLCRDMVVLVVQGFRSNLGVLRASLQHSQEGMWTIFKESGDVFRAVLVRQIGPYLKHLNPASRERRILFAYQMIAGTLVHAALNDPGPLSMSDAALATELERMTKSYLTADRAASGQSLTAAVRASGPPAR